MKLKTSNMTTKPPPAVGDETKDPLPRVAKSSMKASTASIDKKRTELTKAQNKHKDLQDLPEDDRGDNKLEDALLKLEKVTAEFTKLSKTQAELERSILLLKESKPSAVKTTSPAPAPVAPLFAPASTASACSLGIPSPSSSSKINAKQPTMGGLVEGQCGKEAWVGGKPSHNWSGSEDPHAINFPQPTQMQSTSEKQHKSCNDPLEAH